MVYEGGPMIRTDFRLNDNAGDEAIKTAQALRPGRPIKIRVQPGIFSPDERAARGGQYKAWPTVHWTVECDTVREALAVRDALRAFFIRLGTDGPKAVEGRLRRDKEDAA
jgi:hypothetical protein